MIGNLGLDEREIAAMYAENTGNIYKRKGVITDRWLDGLIQRVDFYNEESLKEVK